MAEYYSLSPEEMNESVTLRNLNSSIEHFIDFNTNTKILDRLSVVYEGLSSKDPNKIVNKKNFFNSLKVLKEFFSTDTEETALLIFMIKYYLDNDKIPVSLCKMADYFQFNSFGIESLKSIANSLVLKNLIITITDSKNPENKTFYAVKDSTLTALFTGNKKILEKDIENNKKIILPAKIKDKKLFYKEDAVDQINEIKEILDGDNFETLHKKMKSKGFQSGMSIILYGPSGSGKTETVLQLAKQTDRKVYRFDLSLSHSKWVGETLENIKKELDTYDEMVRVAIENKEKIPIMLFNEADALFTRRSSDFLNHVFTSEKNTEMCFLLDYMEKHEGVIFLTTNFPENIDEAFNRRFLYRVKLDKVDSRCIESIWIERFNFITEEQAKYLSKNYNLSGGEIENIGKRLYMKMKLTNQKTTFEDVERLLKSSGYKPLKQTGTIGFNKAS